jgi:glycolate oxidase iron-sulfur subunit
MAPSAATGPAIPLLALADRCVQCGLCLPHCPTYGLDRSEAESPRGRIAYVRAVAAGALAPSPAGDSHLDHCLGCRRCETACPAGVAFEDLLTRARRDQFERRRPAFRARVGAGLLARPALLGFLLGLYRWLFPVLPRSLRPVPRPPSPSPSPSPPQADASEPVGLFVGCVARSYETPARAALQRLLAATGARAVEAPGQGCCGTAAAHLGDHRQAEALAEANRAAFRSLPVVLSLASGCQERLAASAPGKVQDALVFLAARAGRLRFAPAARRIGLHLPCTQSRDQGSVAALRRLLARVPGLELVELPDRGCCGAAGLHMLAEPERAANLRAPLLEFLRENHVDELLSANIGCRLHLGNAPGLTIRHPLEFLAGQLT